MAFFDQRREFLTQRRKEMKAHREEKSSRFKIPNYQGKYHAAISENAGEIKLNDPHRKPS